MRIVVDLSLHLLKWLAILEKLYVSCYVKYCQYGVVVGLFGDKPAVNQIDQFVTFYQYFIFGTYGSLVTVPEPDTHLIFTHQHPFILVFIRLRYYFGKLSIALARK